MNTSPPDVGLCFAGGGNRAFWQIGLLDVLGDELLPRVAAISACSAGAAAAVLLASDSVEPARHAFARLRRGIGSNLDLRALRRGGHPLPHEPVYRGTLRAAIGPRGLERLRARPFPIRILAAEPPRALRGPLGLVAGLAAYQLEKLARPSALHPTLAPRLGFRPHLHDARDCETLDQLVDLVLASSSTPPFTREGRYAGARLLDGSLVDNAPAFGVDDQPGVSRTVVLLTRPYAPSATGLRDGRLYLAPTDAVPVHRWDYREQARVDDTLDLGRRDAAHHADALRAFLRATPKTRANAL